ncbi:MAG: hypothetical protein IJU90_05515 [Bacteroidales bacterium]|nr:hypothetical protein [Bacteroidales bacterium]
MTEKGVKKSVCLSSSKDQAQNYDKSLGRESKDPNTVQSASLRTLAFCSHFLVFFFTALNFSFGSFSFVSRQKKMNIKVYAA